VRAPSTTANLSADREAGAAVRVDLWGIGNLPLGVRPTERDRSNTRLWISGGDAGGRISYVLEDWLQRLCVSQAFGEACTSLADLLGVR